MDQNGVICNGHGECNPDTKKCRCTGDWTGEIWYIIVEKKIISTKNKGKYYANNGKLFNYKILH